MSRPVQFRRARRAAQAALVALGLAPAVGATAQESPDTPAPAATPPAPVPFGPGERLEYQVKLGVISAGSSHLAVIGVDTIRGRPSYRLEMGIEGGVLFAKVRDRYQSWLDVSTLASLHFIREVHEVRYHSFKEWAIYPEDRRWVQLDEPDEADTMSTSEPLDELAFLYWLRTLPLEVGDTIRAYRYFKNEGNPVEVRVLRRERKEVPAGTFDTIVLQPIIRTRGLFSQGGKAEVYLTDDDSHRLVYLRSEVPVVGSITLHLKSASPGVPLGEAHQTDPPDGF